MDIFLTSNTSNYTLTFDKQKTIDNYLLLRPFLCEVYVNFVYIVIYIVCTVTNVCLSFKFDFSQFYWNLHCTNVGLSGNVGKYYFGNR